MGRAQLFILSGPPFAGKSTLARALEARFGLVRIEIDEVLRARGLDIEREDAWRIAFQRSFRRLHHALAAGTSVVWDAASLTRQQRDRIRATGDVYGAAVSLIHVATSDEERDRRRIANLGSGERVDVPKAAFDEARQEFEIPADDEHPIRFTPDLNLDDWIEKAIAPLIAAAEME
jgi:predicted kinase